MCITMPLGLGPIFLTHFDRSDIPDYIKKVQWTDYIDQHANN